MDVASLLASLQILAKEMGKGGGGSTEEPTVCFALLPIGLGVLYITLKELKARYTRGRLEGGRPLSSRS
jgi:hypothetical protein